MLKQFFTIDKEIEAEISVKKSQFIANIFCVHNEDEVKKKISFVKKKHKDARHYVFAYRLANEAERYSDDGEPSGTAGVPILDILRGNKLNDVLVVVTRYFGGTLLGTGGLVKAYSDATKTALEQTKILKKALAVEYTIMINYQDYSTLQHFCSKNGFIITNSSFSNNIVIKVLVFEEEETIFTKELSELLDGKFEIKDIRRGLYI